MVAGPSTHTHVSAMKDHSSPSSTRRMFNSTKVPNMASLVNALPFAPWMVRDIDTNPETALAESLSGPAWEAIAHKWHPLHTSEYVFIKSALSNFILRYNGDNIDMLHQIESRPVFLDHRLTEYANGLPPGLKMKYNPQDGDFREKHILREAVKPFVTEEVYNRRKQPFMGPSRFAAGGPLHQKLKGLLTRENVEALGFVDWSRVSTYLERAFQEKDSLSLRPALLTAQFVVLSQRFHVPKAKPVVCRC